MTRKLYTTKQASVMTQTNYCTLIRLVRAKGLPHYLAGRYMLFDKDGIEAINKNKRTN